MNEGGGETESLFKPASVCLTSVSVCVCVFGRETGRV